MMWVAGIVLSVALFYLAFWFMDKMMGGMEPWWALPTFVLLFIASISLFATSLARLWVLTEGGG